MSLEPRAPPSHTRGMQRRAPTRRTVAVLGAAAVATLLAPDRAVRSLFVLGDSWAAGLHADPARALGQVAAARLHWAVTVDAVSGTGYVTDAGGGAAYADRVARVEPSVRADLVVVQGGSNDRDASQAELAAGARRTLRALGSRFPAAPRVMLGPGPDPEPVTAEQRAVDDVLADVAEAEGVPYISMLRAAWIPSAPTRVLDPRNHHPTIDGQAYLGLRLEQRLRGLYPRLTRSV